MKKTLKRIILLTTKQYTSIGGQAVIEGVMMRSPNAFVVAVRKPDGSIRLRRDQWYGLSKKLDFLKKPGLRGVLMLVETMANGLVSLNYSANIAMAEEEREKALKKGKTIEEFEASQKKKEKVDIATFLTMAVSFSFGIGLFVFAPHMIAFAIGDLFGQSWTLDSFAFHAVDGVVKAAIFVGYIWGISFMKDVYRVFQYHGAEHKSIATFEAGIDLTVDNARKFTTLHPRCGTSFIFFLILISIIMFSAVFTLVPIGTNLPPILRHVVAVLFKVALMLPVAGISYELIKTAGKCSDQWWARAMSAPGMLLQKLTTKEPDDKQLEVALSSIKAVLFLEDKYNLKDAKSKVLNLEEIDIQNINEIETTNSTLKEFLE
ncbi:DUF1385 domain-containing protein [Peredibacter sp. HCB2-198]|uniref:DUF1385 domain-containing protein n=1 Tax=Peredibacter sp. HCB2-198 TaxID=3383025 RepID=UPI0038B61189